MIFRGREKKGEPMWEWRESLLNGRSSGHVDIMGEYYLSKDWAWGRRAGKRIRVQHKREKNRLKNRGFREKKMWGAKSKSRVPMDRSESVQLIKDNQKRRGKREVLQTNRGVTINEVRQLNL